MFDIKSNPRYPTSSTYDGMATRLMANLTNSSDLSQSGFRFLSNGLKMTILVHLWKWLWGYIFIWCFGQSLVGSNNIPCTASYNMTKARTIADLGTGFVNISDTGTEGTKVAVGTTAQRGLLLVNGDIILLQIFFEGRAASVLSYL